MAGVENLFSLEFYKLASRSLSEGGVLGQWLQNYSMNKQTITMVLRTVKRVFRYAEVYKIGFGDILIVASQKPLNHNFPDEKFLDPFVYKFLRSFGFQKKEDIYLSQVLNNDQYEQLLAFIFEESKDIHSLTKPKLSYRADRDLFMFNNSEPFNLTGAFFTNDVDKKENKRRKAFQSYKDISFDVWKKKCPGLSGFNFLCQYMKRALKEYQSFSNKDKSYPVQLKNYSFLRKHNLIKGDVIFLNRFFSKVLEIKYMHEDTPLIYVNERIQEGEYEVARKHIALLKEKNMLDEKKYESLRKHIDSIVDNIKIH